MKLIHLRNPCWCNITHHAVEQFVSRWAKDKSYLQAEDELVALLHTSKQVGKTLRGDLIYVSQHAPDIRMVVKDRNVCVTVLPQSNNIQNLEEIIQAELEEQQRLFDEEKEVIQIEIETKVTRTIC